MPVELHNKARQVMEALDKASDLSVLKQYEIKRLVGDRSDQFSLRINRQYERPSHEARSLSQIEIYSDARRRFSTPALNRCEIARMIQDCITSDKSMTV